MRRRALVPLVLLVLLVAWWQAREAVGGRPEPRGSRPERRERAARPSARAADRWAGGEKIRIDTLPSGHPPLELAAETDTGDGYDEPARIAVRVRDPRDGDVRVRLRPCRGAEREGRERVAAGDTVFRFKALAGPCTVQALRRDGGIPAWSEAVVLDLEQAGSYTVDLDLPAERTGGLGVSFQAEDDAMVVLQVIPGTPAEELGLAPGDRIVEVDGLPTGALTATEFQQVLAGPEGTGVRFLVEHDGDDAPAEYEIVRMWFP